MVEKRELDSPILIAEPQRNSVLTNFDTQMESNTILGRVDSENEKQYNNDTPLDLSNNQIESMIDNVLLKNHILEKDGSFPIANRNGACHVEYPFLSDSMLYKDIR